MSASMKTLWEILWDYDPNGLVAVDSDLNIRVVNPAFRRMFNLGDENLVGTPAESVLGDMSDFRHVWSTAEVLRRDKHEYPEHGLTVSKVMFRIEEEEVIACIMVVFTNEAAQRAEIMRLRTEVIENVNEVIDKQMKAAQEIAGLLGESTAEAKVSLVRMLKVVQQEPA
jgi:transcriptional regulator with PAS, ATPase and Fis domain